ncbi:MAG: pantetheine-phosphate adenylyltransferase [Schleiferiaceae bacterium]|jgi:pantetheine-phosphate adenylyltransferase|nr:pantetheine-phosphate adenylyltransferase [Schleiferiaceae bacterium]
MKIALFPGSFDPITRGHVDVVKRALPLFDKVVMAIGINANKKYMFDLEQRKNWINDAFAEDDKVEVQTYEGLTVDYAQSIGAHFLLRGLRNPADFEFEKAIAQANAKMATDIQTVFLLTSPETAFISSSIVRDVIKNKGDYTLFVPDAVRV